MDATNVFALAVFMLYPLAPPRMMTQYFADTIKEFGPAFYAKRELANYYNAFAAMPSLHFTWTAIFGYMFLRSGRRWLQVLGVLYPMLTLAAIVITGNHYILDAFVGVLIMIASLLTLRVLRGIRDRYGDRYFHAPWSLAGRAH